MELRCFRNRGSSLTFSPEYSESEPKGDREVLSWVLDTFRRASIARQQFFNHQFKMVEGIVKKTLINVDSEISSRDWALYCAANLNIIFSVMQTIESYHGALTTSDFLARNPSSLERARSILIDPTDHQGGVISMLQRKALTPKMIANLTSIPRFDRYEKPINEKLTRIYQPCFQRFELCGRYSYKYSNMLKPVRHVYAHNY